jgi:LacI family transcriptional regulator
MAQHGLDPAIAVEVALARAGAPEAAGLLLDHPRRPTAAVCFNDIVAAGLANGLSDRGARVGADVSVVGFDDLAEAEPVRPRLTSVAAIPAEVGEAVARLLLDRLAAPDRPFRRIISRTRLIERQSSGPAG